MVEVIVGGLYTLLDAMLSGVGITWVWIKLVEKPIIYHRVDAFKGKKFKIFIGLVTLYFLGKLFLVTFTQWGIWKKVFFVLGGHSL